MSNQARKRTSKEMRRVIAAHKASGLSRIEFCKKNNLKAYTFSYWLRRFQKLDAAGNASHFAQVKVTNKPTLSPPPSSPPSGFKVTINDNFGVTVPMGFHADSLRALVEVLSSC